MTLETTDNISLIKEDKEKVSPPYISFLTFNNLIPWLESEGVPVKFDRSFWEKKYGGSLGLQLMTGMRFLGLLKGDYTQPKLSEIINTKGDDRKKLLADMIRQAYAAVDFSQLSGATPNMLKEWFGKYNLEGSTERKARSFFINALKAYDIPLSNSLKKIARNKQTGRGTPTREKKPEIERINLEQTQRQTRDTQSQATGQVFKVMLNSGCVLRLVLDRELFDLDKSEIMFVYDVVNRMKEYRKK